MRRGRAVLLAAAAVLALAGTATATRPPRHEAASGPAVSVPGRYFAPRHLHVLIGEAVRWRNEDSAVHTATAVDGSWDSGRLRRGDEFTRAFETPGRYEYVCRVHRSMRAVVEVSVLALSGPERPLIPGATAALSGRAPAGTAEVLLERLPQAAGAPEVVDRTAPAADGSFAFSVPVTGPAVHRARAGTATSRALRLPVAPQVALDLRRSRRRLGADVRVAPPQPGASAVLERYVRERFDFRPLRRARLRAGRAVRIDLGSIGRGRLRARLVQPAPGWSPGVSPVVRVGRPRPGRHGSGH